MKKLKLLCAMLLSFTLIGCSSGPAQIKTKGQNTIDGYMNYEILYSQKTTKIEPKITGDFYTYYHPNTTGNVFVDLVMKVENISGKKIAIQDLKGIFNIEDKDYSANQIIEKDDTTLSTSGNIGDKETKTVHMYVEVDAKTDLTKDITYTLVANDEEVELSYKISDLKEKKDYQQTGYVLKDEKAEITLGEFSITDTLNPEKPSMIYQYYKSSDGKILVALKVSIKNISNEDLSTDKLVGVKAIVDGTQYAGGLVAEDENQANIKTNVTIKAGQTHTGYLISEIDQADQTKDIEMSIYYGGKTVYIKK